MPLQVFEFRLQVSIAQSPSYYVLIWTIIVNHTTLDLDHQKGAVSYTPPLWLRVYLATANLFRPQSQTVYLSYTPPYTYITYTQTINVHLTLYNLHVMHCQKVCLTGYEYAVCDNSYTRSVGSWLILLYSQLDSYWGTCEIIIATLCMCVCASHVAMQHLWKINLWKLFR